MKDAWNQLGTDYEASPSVLIGDVDCTVEQDVCTTHGVNGYPTIKYWLSEDGKDAKDYQGGRDLSDLQKFVADTLDKPGCQVSDMSKACTDKEKDFYEKNKDKSADDVAAAMARLEGMKAG
eukprot:287970_1